MTLTERITGAALLTSSGELWSLPAPNRHHHLFALAAFQGREVPSGIQGFTTSAERFVTREEALALAEAANQPISKHGDPRQLYSEDLW